MGIGTFQPISPLVVVPPGSTAANGEQFYIDGSGNVNIGTYSTGTTYSSLILRGTNANSNVTLFNQGNGLFSISDVLGYDGSSRTAITFKTTGHGGTNVGQQTVGFIGSASDYLSGALSNTIGTEGQAISVQTSGTKYALYGIYGQNQINGSGGTTTNSYGVYGTSATQTTGTLTNDYAAGFAGHSVFAGNVGIGTVLDGDNYITTPGPNGSLIVEGNEGVGTVNPSQKLDVNGAVRATAYIAGSTAGVNCSGPPDAGFTVVNGIVTAC